MECRHAERDPGIPPEVDLLFALEEIVERADQALQAVEGAVLAADMAMSQAPDDGQVAALRALVLANLAACEQWVADAADAITQSTQRLAMRRQAATTKLRFHRGDCSMN